MTGRLTIWAEIDAHSRITREADTTVESAQGLTTSVERCVWRRGAARCYRYEPLSKLLHRPFTITAAEAAKEDGPFRTINDLNGAGVARLLTSLMHHAPAGVHLMPERRLNGALVYPIRVRMGGHPPGGRPPTLIYYFDAHTYILRGVVVLRPSGPGFADLVVPHIMLIERESVALAAVPAGTFKLRPPTGKQVLVVLP